MKTLINLFISFFKVGSFAFGGGFAMLPLIEGEVIIKHGWISQSDFIDILALSEMTPGPIAINTATFIGYRIEGLKGALVATLGVSLPSFIIMSLIFIFIKKFKNSPVLGWIFTGLRPAVLGLIGAAVISVSRNSIVDIKSLSIAFTSFYLIGIKKFHPILIILLSSIIGIVFL